MSLRSPIPLDLAVEELQFAGTLVLFREGGYITIWYPIEFFLQV